MALSIEEIERALAATEPAPEGASDFTNQVPLFQAIGEGPIVRTNAPRGSIGGSFSRSEAPLAQQIKERKVEEFAARPFEERIRALAVESDPGVRGAFQELLTRSLLEREIGKQDEQRAIDNQYRDRVREDDLIKAREGNQSQERIADTQVGGQITTTQIQANTQRAIAEKEAELQEKQLAIKTAIENKKLEQALQLSQEENKLQRELNDIRRLDAESEAGLRSAQAEKASAEAGKGRAELKEFQDSKIAPYRTISDDIAEINRKLIAQGESPIDIPDVEQGISSLDFVPFLGPSLTNLFGGELSRVTPQSEENIERFQQRTGKGRGDVARLLEEQGALPRQKQQREAQQRMDERGSLRLLLESLLTPGGAQTSELLSRLLDE